MQNGNVQQSSHMSPGQRGNPADRVRRRAEIRALNEARIVPWKILANAADKYTEWQTFALWLRAVLDSCEALPANIARAIEKRSPFLLRQIGSAALGDASSCGFRVWGEVTQWSEANIFGDAKHDRWLNAIRYFSSHSLQSMKAWSHWENVDQQWSSARPEILPDYEQWRQSVSSVTRLSNPRSDLQQILDSVRSIPEARWQQLFEAFMELTTLSLWIETLLWTGGDGRELVARELTLRYPHFDANSIEYSQAPISILTNWVIGHEAPFTDGEPPLPALSYHVKYHPAYCARRNFAERCRQSWGHGPVDVPLFARWKDEADAYFEK